MYNKIMVPLDGSELAESVFPHVESIIKGRKSSELFLARVIEPVTVPKIASSSALEELKKDIMDIEQERIDNAKHYLEDISHRLDFKETKININVLKGQAADCLVEFAIASGVNVIIIATHGRSGALRWVWGSVAEQILRSSCIPVLMIRSPDCMPSIIGNLKKFKLPS